MNTQKNSVGWFEIYVDDMDRAKKFYETMLGQKLEKLSSPEGMPGEMWTFGSSECDAELPGATGALMKMDGFGPGAGGTIVYFNCNDCAEEEARAAQNGGTVVQSKFSIGEYGNIALLQDTEGNMIGLHSQN